MRLTAAKKLTALFLCVLMLIGTAVPAFAADKDKSADDDGAGKLVTVSDSLKFITYDEYLTKYPDREEEGARATKSFTVDATDYYVEGTTADVEVTELGGVKCIKTPAEGNTAWKFIVPESGFYTMSITYRPISALYNDVERVMYLNGKVPFQETRHIGLSKTWKLKYSDNYDGTRDTLFVKDSNGNEMRPDLNLDDSWTTYEVSHSGGYYTTPFEYYLEEGENVLVFEAVNDTVALKSFEFKPYEASPTYSSVKKEYEAKGYTEAADVATIYIDAEAPTHVSDFMLTPGTDYSSAVTEPQSSTNTLRNVMSYSSWNAVGQWVRYSFTVEKSGLYVIAPRYDQTQQAGAFSSRKIRIDGEVPFAEAETVRFNYKNDWQLNALSDDDGEALQFYLEAGEHTVELEVTLGDMAVIIKQANDIMQSLKDDYLEITKLTGPTPDENRDYGFARIMPDVVADFSIQSHNLRAISNMLSQTSGVKSDNSAKLLTMVELFRKVGADDKKIAANMTEINNQISALGEWITEITAQPLGIDYILIQPASAELPRGNAPWYKATGYEFAKFFNSFFTDYDSVSNAEGSEEEYDKELLIWTTAGRDQAQITRNLISEGFAKETGTNVTLKLAAANTLLVSILAGVAPDVSIDATSPLEMAVRGALIPFDGFDTFDQVAERFADSAMVPLRLYDETYAIPVGQTFPIMFYREDILGDLGVEVPKTWDELLALVPVLQFNNMEVGISSEFISTYVYQGGGNYWEDGGMKTALDSKVSLDAFDTMMDWFTQYSLPIQFNGPNRMKTGEMPLFIGNYTTYFTLSVSAPEIAGLWKIAEIPGYVKTDEDGNEYIDNHTVATSSGIIMTKSVRDQELAWDFIDWYTDASFQADFSNEMSMLLGPSGRQATANIEAFEELPWTAEEKKVLLSALNKSVGIEIYPGDYMIVRYLNFAFNGAYNGTGDASELMQNYAQTINKELTRKRKEFHLMVEDEWQAVKAFTGLETYTDWRRYAEANGIEDYQDFMDENGITTGNYADWTSAVKLNGYDRDYKTFISENR